MGGNINLNQTTFAGIHLALEGVTSDQHHAQLHAAGHADGQADELSHDALKDYVGAEHISLPAAVDDVLSNHDKALHDGLGLSHDSLDDVSVDDHHAQLHAAKHANGQPDVLSHNALADYAANRHFLATEVAFLNLSDTPAAYAGEGSKIVAVNVAENALEFIVAPAGNGGVSTPSYAFMFLGY